GWMLIARNMTNGRDERDAEAVAAWIAAHGEAEGFRVPNVRERSRAMGTAAYTDEPGLAEQELYDGQGNSFDPQAVLMRLQAGLQMSDIRGGHRHHSPPLDVLLDGLVSVSDCMSAGENVAMSSADVAHLQPHLKPHEHRLRVEGIALPIV
ncbi:MAG: hypothetical protein ACKPKO_34460, partial [Candidatus Fonsibacter sp.]